MSTGCRQRKPISSRQGDKVKQKFPDKLWSVVCDDSEDSCLWTASGESILINKGKFTHKFLSNSSRLFRTSNFKSFVRQLNLYGFRKVNKMRRRDYEIWWEYRNENFIRDRPDLLKLIRRKASVDDMDDVTDQNPPVRRRRDPRRVTKVFNLRLAQLDDDPDEESNDECVREEQIDLVPSKSQNSDLILDFLQKNSHVSSKKDYLLSFVGDDSCYELFSDQEIEESTKEVESIIARMDAIEGSNQIKDYSMRSLTNEANEDKDENNKENKSQEKTGMAKRKDNKYSQERERIFPDQSFVIDIPMSQEQILDGNDSFITVSLFPDLPSSQEYNPMLGTSDSDEITYETKSHLSFTPTYPLSPSL